MKRLVVVLGGLLALPAFAEVAPFFYDDVTEYADAEMTDADAVVGDEIVAENDAISAPVVQPSPALRAKTMRTASRVTPTNVATTSGNRASGSRVVASRGTTTSGVVRGTSAARGVASRSGGALSSGTVATRRGVSSGAGVARATLSGGTNPLYLPNSTGRVGVRAVGSTSKVSAARAPSVSVSNTATVTSVDTVKETTAAMDTLAELTDYCKAQYTACMDNFCNVLDDNQGRCSCSKNLKNYEKTETALKAATEELQEVAQKIQYIGLTSDEITTLFTQTEAELTMQNSSDSTKLKNDLDRIKNMIVEVKTGSASAIGDTAGISLDLSNLLSFNFDSSGFDLSALFGGTSSANTSTITNQRGEALYKTAASRCKAAVLNTCSAQGVDIAIISNSYDMEIDKQCIAYERSLTDANTQMVSTVRNAKAVLQKARLMVAKQKNQYDLRGCISALDSCMQDDYVCGTDYEECLDPTGKYIVSGSVVVGSMPGISGGNFYKCEESSGSGSSGSGSSDSAQQQPCKATAQSSAQDGLYITWNNNNKNIWSPVTTNPYTMSQYIKDTLKETSASATSSTDLSTFLQGKIGYHNNSTGKNYGMCISILNKCQDYTYDKNGKYMADNSVIANYMERAFRQIKASQDTVLANYATSCLSDVASCLSQNNYSFAASSGGNYSDMAIRACLPVINTCRSVTLGEAAASVKKDDLGDVYKWLDAGIATSYQTTCESAGGEWKDGACTCPTDKHMKADASGKVCVCDSEYTMTDGECKSNSTTTGGTGGTGNTGDTGGTGNSGGSGN